MLDFTKGRSRPANYISICRTIAGSYILGIPHGAQKDAVQNGFHTISGAKPLKFIFDLIKNKKGIFFTMTDSNTKGLTGEVLKIEEYDKLKESDHWARFEGFGFTVENPDAIGARGQGKFIFLATSKDHLMFYDSLRDNGSYRLGATKATNTDCPILHWDEDEACDKLRELTGLEPLWTTGTRIIIVNPIDDLKDELKNGTFVEAIEETWFRAIEKRKAEIYVKTPYDKKTAKVPSPFPVPLKDSVKIKVWIRNNDTIKLLRGESYRIKHLHVAYKSDGEVPEQLRGVAIIHNNMKVTSINMDDWPVNIRNNIYGFIEFDRELDRELRKEYNQFPNHYDLKWRRSIPKAIKEYMLDELRKFGHEKLNIGVDPREIRKQVRTAAEEWALRYLSKYAKELDLVSKKRGLIPPRPRLPSPPHTKKIGVMLHNFNFPEPERAPRVNWGEEIKDFEVMIFNKTPDHLRSHLRIFILFGDREVSQIFDKRAINVIAKSKLAPFGPFNIVFSKDDFPDPGVYRLRIRLINERDRIEIDLITRKIYLEKDPDFRAPFEVMATDGFSEPFEKRQWMTEGTLGDNPVLYYNTQHPAYKWTENDQAQLGHHLFEILLDGSVDFILNRPDEPDGSPDYHPFDATKITKDPRRAYREISDKLSTIKSRYYEEI